MCRWRRSWCAGGHEVTYVVPREFHAELAKRAVSLLATEDGVGATADQVEAFVRR